jgi:hypothetical protein
VFGSELAPVADVLVHAQLGTLLLDLLTAPEERTDTVTAGFRFNIPLLADRTTGVVDWVAAWPRHAACVSRTPLLTRPANRTLRALLVCPSSLTLSDRLRQAFQQTPAIPNHVATGSSHLGDMWSCLNAVLWRQATVSWRSHEPAHLHRP